MLVVAWVHEAGKAELRRTLAHAKDARILDVTNSVEATHLAVDKSDVGNACGANRRSDEGSAGTGASERRGLRGADAIQLSVHAGKAIAHLAEDPEFTLALGIDAGGRSVAGGKG